VRHQQLLFHCLWSSSTPRRACPSAGRIWTPVSLPVSRLARRLSVSVSAGFILFVKSPTCEFDCVAPSRKRALVQSSALSAREHTGSSVVSAREQANCFSCFRLSARVPSHLICFLRSCAQRQLCPVAFSARPSSAVEVISSACSSIACAMR
jgi:hypothetical protein